MIPREVLRSLQPQLDPPSLTGHGAVEEVVRSYGAYAVCAKLKIIQKVSVTFGEYTREFLPLGYGRSLPSQRLVVTSITVYSPDYPGRRALSRVSENIRGGKGPSEGSRPSMAHSRPYHF